MRFAIIFAVAAAFASGVMAQSCTNASDCTPAEGAVITCPAETSTCTYTYPTVEETTPVEEAAAPNASVALRVKMLRARRNRIQAGAAPASPVWA